jgi:DNA-binding NarL/FixJ family response regulator
VLICDDRPDVRRELSQALRSGSRDLVHEVPDGNALLDAYEEGADQVLIGVHSGTTVGAQAVELLLAAHPDAAPIVIGSMADLDLLAGAYARGTGGLLLWEPETLAHEPDQR